MTMRFVNFVFFPIIVIKNHSNDIDRKRIHKILSSFLCTCANYINRFTLAKSHVHADAQHSSIARLCGVQIKAPAPHHAYIYEQRERSFPLQIICVMQ